MRKHVRKESDILKCTSCEYETKDENEYLNHIVDNHSTVHVCQNCDNTFTAKNELIDHMGTVHGLNQNKASVAESLDGDVRKTIKCFNCGTMLDSKNSLMKHKKEKHWKERKCAFFHGVGNGCRFPGNICFNIHMMEEQQFRGQVQGAGGQGQGARGQGQAAGGSGRQASGQANNSHSWAGVASGRGSEVRDKMPGKTLIVGTATIVDTTARANAATDTTTKPPKTANINQAKEMKMKPVNQVLIWQK